MTNAPARTSPAYDKIGGAFAGQTAPFGVHPNDNDRAFEYLREARRHKLTWADAKADIRAYLALQGVTEEYIEEQVEFARPQLEPWLG